jgi:exodeoxyribonuclease VII, large subunit
LFDQAHKRKLPFLPRRIGIVTSPKGAVIHDMLTVLERRFQGIPVILFPSQVQGDSAAKMLVEGISHLNNLPDSQQIDVLILGRGGGSIEDLWAFNDEHLARAIFSSEIPVISAVGHETDFTIADFVSDVRAPTPSAAMELAVPNKMDLKNTLSQKEKHLHNIIINLIEQLNEYVEAKRQRLASPTAVVQQYIQQVDDMDSLLRERTRNIMENFQSSVSSLSEKLFLLNPGRELASQKNGVDLMQGRLKLSIRHLHEKLEDSVKLQADLLNSLSPLSVLHRGYSVR